MNRDINHETNLNISQEFISFNGKTYMIPRSGGEKVYLEAAYRRPRLLATVAFAIQIIVLGFTAAGCIIFTEYVSSKLACI